MVAALATLALVPCSELLLASCTRSKGTGSPGAAMLWREHLEVGDSSSQGAAIDWGSAPGMVRDCSGFVIVHLWFLHKQADDFSLNEQWSVVFPWYKK